MPDASGGSRLWHGGMREVMNGVYIIINVEFLGAGSWTVWSLAVRCAMACSCVMPLMDVPGRIRLLYDAY